jgi:hypothetical protein
MSSREVSLAAAVDRQGRRVADTALRPCPTRRHLGQVLCDRARLGCGCGGRPLFATYDASATPGADDRSATVANRR